MRLCVIFINQLSRGTPGKENGVRRTRGKELRREAKSEECRGGAGAAALVVALLFYIRKRAELLFR